MDHAGHVERNGGEQEVADHILQAKNQAEQDLTDEQADCRDEVGFCNRLRFELHDQFSPLDQPWLLGGQLAVLIELTCFRKATMAFSCSSVKLNCGMLRRPGMPSFGRLWMKALVPSSP